MNAVDILGVRRVSARFHLEIPMAVDTSSYKLYLFKKDQYLKIDPVTWQIVGKPQLNSQWNGLAQALNNGAALDRIDGAAWLPASSPIHPNTGLFLKGDTYCIYDKDKDAVTTSGKLTEIFKNLPSDNTVDFTKDVDAVTLGSQNTDPFGWIHLLKGPKGAAAELATLDFQKNSFDIGSLWNIPFPFSLGVRPATTFAPVIVNNYLFRGDSWTNYGSTSGISTESLWPGTYDLGFDDELDAIMMAPVDK